MESLFDEVARRQLRQRIEAVTMASPRQWGSMSPAQMLAHCALGMQMATGDLNPPRVFIGRVLGPLIKPLALKDEAPMKRNSPTAPSLVVKDKRDLDEERQRLLQLIERFAAAGPAACTTHPHAFFGRLTPEEWAKLMHKHLDHHLRQFNV